MSFFPKQRLVFLVLSIFGGVNLNKCLYNVLSFYPSILYPNGCDTCDSKKNKTPCRGMLSALFCRVLDSEKYSLTISCPAIILNFSSDCAICRFCRFLFAFLQYLHRCACSNAIIIALLEIIIFVYCWGSVSFSLSILSFVISLYSGV